MRLRTLTLLPGVSLVNRRGLNTRTSLVYRTISSVLGVAGVAVVVLGSREQRAAAPDKSVPSPRPPRRVPIRPLPHHQ